MLERALTVGRKVRKILEVALKRLLSVSIPSCKQIQERHDERIQQRKTREERAV